MAVQIKCLRCNRTVNVQENWDRNATCSQCGGYFQEISQQSQNYSVSGQFQQLGQKIQGVPHIILDNKRIYTQKSQPLIQNYPQPQNIPYNVPQNANLPYTKNKYDKIKEIGLWVMVTLVVSYAAYRIILAFLGK